MKQIFNKINNVVKIVRNIFLVIATLSLILTFFVYFSNKDKTTIDPKKSLDKSRSYIYKDLEKLKANKTKEGKQILSLYRNSYCFLIGETCTDNPNDGDINFYSSFFGSLTKGIIAPYQSPPASGVYWVYSGLQKAGFVPNTYAAEGIGFAALKPIANIWKIFRDVALTILVLVITVIGFLIMFRVKINPQTVITLENSLPRIVVSLLLIVFSFAIAGFLIDLMYVVIVLSTSILSRSDIVDRFISGGSGSLFGEILGRGEIIGSGPGSGIGNALLSLLPNQLSYILRFIVVWISYVGILQIPTLEPFKEFLLHAKVASDGNVPFIGGLIGLGMSVAVATALTAVFGSLAGYILSFLILITTGLLVFFRILLSLLMAYIRIILFIIFSPLMLMLNAIPGKNFFGIWIKNLVADLAAFPITAILIMVASNVIHVSVESEKIWSPPFLSTNITAADFSIIIGIGILFIIPNIIKKTREALGIKGTGIGAGLFFSGITGTGAAAMGGINKISMFGSLGMYAQNNRFIPGPIRDWLTKGQSRSGSSH